MTEYQKLVQGSKTCGRSEEDMAVTTLDWSEILALAFAASADPRRSTAPAAASTAAAAAAFMAVVAIDRSVS
jgi:hypothetical protein